MPDSASRSLNDDQEVFGRRRDAMQQVNERQLPMPFPRPGNGGSVGVSGHSSVKSVAAVLGPETLGNSRPNARS